METYLVHLGILHEYFEVVREVGCHLGAVFNPVVAEAREMAEPDSVEPHLDGVACVEARMTCQMLVLSLTDTRLLRCCESTLSIRIDLPYSS